VGEIQSGGVKGINECFRIDRGGQIVDTQYQLISRDEAEYWRESRGYYSVAPNANPFGYYGGYDQRPGTYYYDNNGRYVTAPRAPGPYYGQSDPYRRMQVLPPRDPYGREYQTPQRIDPGYLWGNRRYY
jgi:hypothetical protein